MIDLLCLVLGILFHLAKNKGRSLIKIRKTIINHKSYRFKIHSTFLKNYTYSLN